MQHIFETHTNCQRETGCGICDGGLALCTSCGGMEGSLPSQCPGVWMTDGERDRVYAGRLDYHNGRWEPIMPDYICHLMMRVEVHVRVEAMTSQEAANKAFKLAEQWSTQVEPLSAVSTGPEEPDFDEQVLVAEALDGGPPYWGETEELEAERSPR